MMDPRVDRLETLVAKYIRRKPTPRVSPYYEATIMTSVARQGAPRPRVDDPFPALKRFTLSGMAAALVLSTLALTTPHPRATLDFSHWLDASWLPLSLLELLR